MKKIGKYFLFLFLAFVMDTPFVLASSVVDEETYIIKSVKNQNYVIDLKGASVKNNSNIQLYKNNKSKAQQFRLIKNTNGTYSISTIYNTNMVLDVQGGKNQNGTNIQLYKKNKTAAQQWVVRKNKDNTFTFVYKKDTSKVLDIKGGKIQNGSNIQIYKSNGTTAQKFVLEKVVTNTMKRVEVEEGTYFIKNVKNTNYVLDLKGANVSNGNNIQLYTNNKSKAQQWKITKNTNGSYKIASIINENFVLDAKGGKSSNGTNIQLYSSKNVYAQQFYFYKTKEGYYSIASSLNVNALVELQGGNVKNGGNIQLYQYNNTASQKWVLEKVKVEDTKPAEEEKEYVPKQEANANFTNLIVFVKFKDDSRDIFNATKDYTTYKTSNFETVKNMFDKNITYTSYDDSFKNYIKEVTNDKVRVQNVFIQQNYEENKINTYQLKGKKQDYTSGDGIVYEILEALKTGKIQNQFGQVQYDHIEKNVLDNLMIVIQGEKVEDDYADILVNHKTNYGGTEQVHGFQVSNYVMLNSASLVNEDASVNVGGSQAGVISHEFLHVLSLPDLYRKTDDGMPVGPWDIMASASYFKQYPLSYFRAKNNWISSKTIEKSGHYTLDVVGSKKENEVFFLKTPLSDSETIVLEYRQKKSALGQIDYNLPSSGLLMYRVDEKVENQTNANGENYVYVYRPNVTDKDRALDQTYLLNGTYVNNVYNAALCSDVGKNSYGSLDLSAPFTNDTLYYSDGSNSGILIKNITYNSDKTQISFDIEFADYSSNNTWESLGKVDTEASGEKNNLYVDEKENIYMSYYTTKKQVQVKTFHNGSFSTVGQVISNHEISSFIEFNGDFYLASRNATNYGVDIYKLNQDKWELYASYSCDYTENLSFIKAENQLYLAYNSTTTLFLVDVVSNKKITTKDFTYLTSPKMEYWNKKIYLVCSDYFATNSKGKLFSYDIENNIWEEKQESTLDKTNMHDIKVYKDALYVLYGGNNSNPTLVECKENTCSLKATLPIKNYINLSLHVGEDFYISYTSSEDSKTYILKEEKKNFVLYNDNLGLGITNLNIVRNRNTLYALTETNNSIYLKRKNLI